MTDVDIRHYSFLRIKNIYKFGTVRSSTELSQKSLVKFYSKVHQRSTLEQGEIEN